MSFPRTIPVTFLPLCYSNPAPVSDQKLSSTKRHL